MIELETMISLYTGVHIMDANVMMLKDVIENEFQSGKICKEAYQHIYDTNQHICERFHMQEDMDVKLDNKNQV